MDTSGFYKMTEDLGNYTNDITGKSVCILFAPNFVSAPDFELTRSAKDSHVYPTYGWYYFDTEEAMSVFFNIHRTEPNLSYVEPIKPK